MKLTQLLNQSPPWIIKGVNFTAAPRSIIDVGKDKKSKRKAFKNELNDSNAQTNKKAKMEINKNIEEAIPFKNMSPAAGDTQGHLVAGEEEGHPTAGDL